MSEEKINKAILTLEVLIDECKEDGTYYTAQKEWEALEVFKQLQNNWNELKKWCKENQYIGKTITFENDVTYTEILSKMQELEGNNE